VVKDHNGYIDLETEIGAGTSFYIYFPITRSTTVDHKTDRISGGNESILVIDDDKVQRDVQRTLLEKLGYRVSAVESGEKAIEMLEQNSFDLMILDMVMPAGIDGTETYRRALKINPHQKAIIISGFSESKRVQEALSLGVGAFLRKPLTRDNIGAAVRIELDKVKASV
jgi:CheY-like chemotaxis protein